MGDKELFTSRGGQKFVNPCPKCGTNLWPTYVRDMDAMRYKKLPTRRFWCNVCKCEWKLHPAD